MTLVTPARKGRDPVLGALIGAMVGKGRATREIGPGLIEAPNWNPEMTWAVDPWIDNLGDHGHLFDWGGGSVSEVGVVDTPGQWLDLYGREVHADKANWAVFFVHIPKEQGEGGWRWRKWGFYVGTGEPKCEYLADEEGFENGVWTFNVHPVTEVQR